MLLFVCFVLVAAIFIGGTLGNLARERGRKVSLLGLCGGGVLLLVVSVVLLLG